MSVSLECGCRPPKDKGLPRSGQLCDEAIALWLAHTRALLRNDLTATQEAWRQLNEHWDKP